MRVTSFLKVQLADYEPMVLPILDGDFSQLLSQYPHLGIDDLRVLSHLQFIFPIMSQIGALLPYPSISPPNINTVALYGVMFDQNIIPEMPASPPTLACFTNYYLRRFIVLSIAAEHPHLESVIMNSNKEELEAVLRDIDTGGMAGEIRVVERPTSLKILRCTPEDFDIVLGRPILVPMNGGLINEPPTGLNLDAFEAVKSRLVNQNQFLNDSGYSPAEYVESGDYIQMWADTVLSPNPNFGDAYTPPICTPTSIEFLPRVVATPEKPVVTLRVSITVDGRPFFNNYENGGTYTDISFELNDWNSEDNTPQGIVDEIFLYSGIDLMRQRDADSWFTYSPYSTDSPDNVPVTIRGRERGIPSTPYEKYFDVDCVMTFMLIDNLEPNQIDFTREQWGEEVKIYSCSEFRNMAM